MKRTVYIRNAAGQIVATKKERKSVLTATAPVKKATKAAGANRKLITLTSLRRKS